MNREMRRMMEREERRQKKGQKEGGGRQSAVPRKAPPREKKPLLKRISGFLHEVRVELKKVSWPTREQMIAFTTVTVITSLALTLVIFGLDVGLKEIVLLVIGDGGSG